MGLERVPKLTYGLFSAAAGDVRVERVDEVGLREDGVVP